MSRFLLRHSLSIAMTCVLTACHSPTEPSEARQAAFESCGVTEAEYARLMALPQKDFDQDFDGGWRPIAEIKGCKDVAGEIILDYILYSGPYPPRNIGILRWHAGQMKAGAGETEEAIRLFRGTYHTPDDTQDWNFYVDATIAFLEDDKAAIQDAYDGLAQMEVPESLKAARRKFLEDNPNVTMQEGFIDQPGNLNVVKRLLDCFGKPYSEAYGGCEAEAE